MAKTKKLIQKCAYIYLTQKLPITAKNYKTIYDYKKDGYTISDLKKIIKSRAERIELLQKTRARQKEMPVITTSKDRYEQKKEELFKLLEKKELTQIKNATPFHILKNDYKNYYFQYSCWDDVDWDYYSKRYGHPKITTYRRLSMIAIRLNYDILNLSTWDVPQNTDNSVEKTMKEMVKNLTDKGKKYCEITKAIIDRYYLQKFKKAEISRFAIMDFSEAI